MSEHLADQKLTDGSQSASDSGSPEIEVLYTDGATPLFLAIENTNWREALDIAEASPNQIRTWVRSTGTENTTFDWALWRRLPIHEACRRQAPVWLISALLSTYPESASCKTQFGELPLHLAVECGAAPEVVNLLIVADWDGIIAYDQSGRTPMEILDSTELLEQEDHRIVYESLVRCHTAYTNFQKAALEEQSAIEKKHMAKFCEARRRHEDELKREQQKQNEIRGQVQNLERKIETLNGGIQSRDTKIASFHAEENMSNDRIQALELLVSELKNDFMHENEMVKSLINAVQDKDEEILNRDRKIQTLSNDLLDTLAVQEDEIAGKLIETERSMRAMVRNQIALQKKVVAQTEGLKDLLSVRGIASRTNITKSFPGQRREEQKSHEMNEQADETDVASAVLGAAVAALKKPPQVTM